MPERKVFFSLRSPLQCFYACKYWKSGDLVNRIKGYPACCLKSRNVNLADVRYLTNSTTEEVVRHNGTLKMLFCPTTPDNMIFKPSVKRNQVHLYKYWDSKAIARSFNLYNVRDFICMKSLLRQPYLYLKFPWQCIWFWVLPT